jgi:hypothetical protein
MIGCEVTITLQLRADHPELPASEETIEKARVDGPSHGSRISF